jgi:hypothetical protein
MARENAVRKISEGKGFRQARAWRDEKVIIFFSPRGTARFAGHGVAGDWIVADPQKIVSPGQRVTWQALGDCQTLELDLPEVFEEPRQIVVSGTTASAVVRSDAEIGLHSYEAYVDGQLAIGGSSPRVIIDP